MAMMGPAAESPDAYIAALSGWQLKRCTMMRAAIMAAAPFDETIKWTNLVFVANGPCILIRAEEQTLATIAATLVATISTLGQPFMPTNSTRLGSQIRKRQCRRQISTASVRI